jgi:SAM-dependent methyltransferase
MPAFSPDRDDLPVWDELPSTYDQVADRYEKRFADELADKPRDRELLDAFALAAGDPVVELGCGPGQIGAYVHARGRMVVGIDLSAEMARRARDRLGVAMVADLRRLPLRDATCGGVLAFYSLIHVRRSELVGALAECRRVLRPGGRLLFSAHEGSGDYESDTFLDQHVPFVATFFSLDELVAATRAAGLEIVRAERRAPYPTESQTTRLYVEATTSKL